MEDGAADRNVVRSDVADGVRAGSGPDRPALTTRLRAFLGQLTGTGDTTLVGHLEAQIRAALDGAEVAKQAITGQVASAEARVQIGDVEHVGDAERAQLVAKLYESFITPVDREDLFRLSRSIDDVLDNLRDFVREVDLMHVQDPEHFVDVLQALADGLAQLAHAVHQVGVEIADVPESALVAKKAGNHVRQLYQLAIADLLAGDEVRMEVLRKRELLRRLDVVGLRLGEAADALADGAMKRRH